MGQILLPGRRRGMSGTSWATWNEAGEAGLASKDTFVCFAENTVAGGDETGQGGGLTGADLVLAQNGNIAGAAGGGRTLDGGNDWFDFTVNNAAAFFKRSDKKWTVIQKWSDITDPDIFFNVRDVGVDSTFKILGHNVAKLNAQVNGAVGADTTDNIPGAGTVYLAFWSNGTDTRAGFAITRPTKWSDFAATKRVTIAASPDHTGASFTGRSVGAYAGGASDFVAGKLHYTVFSKIVLIDEAA
jgi:hypothetical protein